MVFNPVYLLYSHGPLIRSQTTWGTFRASTRTSWASSESPQSQARAGVWFPLSNLALQGWLQVECSAWGCSSAAPHLDPTLPPSLLGPRERVTPLQPLGTTGKGFERY